MSYLFIFLTAAFPRGTWSAPEPGSTMRPSTPETIGISNQNSQDHERYLWNCVN
jgi:hypothetical protein